MGLETTPPHYANKSHSDFIDVVGVVRVNLRGSTEMVSFRFAGTLLLGLLLLAGGVASPTVATAGEWPSDKQCKKLKDAGVVKTGWCVAINRRKGNCLGCHMAMVNPWPEGFPPGGNVGPPLVAMKSRFESKEALRAQIYDPTVRNPNTSMPPFGKHRLLSNKQIDQIVEWLWTI
jgi:sulfur-oxidizing protein SoxX